MDSSAVAPRKAPKCDRNSATSQWARASLSVTQTLSASGKLVSRSGDSSSTSAWPRPYGETTTRKKLTSVTKGPSGLSFRYIPGFSPDQSIAPGWIGISAVMARHDTPGPAGDRRLAVDSPLAVEPSRGPCYPPEP